MRNRRRLRMKKFGYLTPYDLDLKLVGDVR